MENARANFLNRTFGSFSRRDWVFAGLLVAAIVLAYQPVWYAGFIWDDDRHVTRPDLRTWTGLRHIWTQIGATQQYYPLIHSAFWFQHKLWGDGPLGYHLVNVALYAFSAVLLYAVLKRLEIPGAWLATAIFALHPVQVETVAWVTELKNVLSGLFYFAAALAYLEYDRTREKRPYDIAFICYVLGLLSKSVIASLPAALLIVFWWKRGRLSWKQDVSPLIPFFVAGIASGLFTAWVERHFVGAEGASYHYTFVERGLIAGRALWFYLSKILWPSGLTFIYPRWEISSAVAWQYLFPLEVVILVGVLIMLARRWRGPLAGFLFFAGTLFPALGFFNVYPFRYSFVADHFQYLASLGIIVPCAAALALAADQFAPKIAGLKTGLGMALVLFLGVLTWQRAWAYQTVEILWNDTLARNPTCLLAHNNLGLALEAKGQVDDAIAQFHQALEIDPNSAEAHNNLGLALYRAEKTDDAIAEDQKALDLAPDNSAIHFNLGNALVQAKRFDEAIDQFQKALVKDPANVGIHFNLGIAYFQNNEYANAAGEFQKAVQLNPNFDEARNDLAKAQARMGR